MFYRFTHLIRRNVPISAASLLVAFLVGCVVSSDTKRSDDTNKWAEIHRKYPCTAGAHRGASEDHTENTMAALLAAENDEKYDFIEFDVQYSKDGKIVVYHDKRMFRLFGNLRAIASTTFAELSKITDGEIAAYDQVMDVLNKKLNIEIKSRGDLEEDQRLVDEIIADLRAPKRTKEVLISSISSDVVKYVSQTYPDIPTGQVFWLTSSTYLPFDRLTRKLYEEIGETQADYLMLNVANLRNMEDLLAMKPKEKTLIFWDFDDTIYIVHKDHSDRLWGDSDQTPPTQAL